MVKNTQSAIISRFFLDILTQVIGIFSPIYKINLAYTSVALFKINYLCHIVSEKDAKKNVMEYGAYDFE